MAVRWDKERVREQAAEEIARSDPGERPLVTFHAIGASRPPGTRSRLLSGVVGTLRRTLSKDCFVSLTERTVVIHATGGFRYPGPRTRVHTLLRTDHGTLVEEAGRGRLYSHVRLALPYGEGSLECQVAHYWQPELDRFVEELTGAPVR
ncbi:hypothetical protein [Streptomyces sp. RFCAC02]|uniref:hypothetical protein n=1 Tax=Streptomyces sp. RFCAC02 TaxID=2499143 RepID=UPI00101EC583|nr:hypothetical protein [Streptomyces sp. RFCAC02]